jgi:RHS repeat-associated protein
VSDDAIINLTGITVTHRTSVNDAVISLTSQSTLALSAGALSLGSASVINGDFQLSGGTLSGAGDLSISGLLTWTDGRMTGAGHTRANGGMSISGSATKYLDGRTLDNTGQATWTGSGFIGTGNGAVINNPAGATFNIQTDGTQIYNAYNGAAASFNNAGTLKKSAGTGTVRFAYAVLNNTGTVDGESGTLSLEDGGALGGTLTANTGGAVDLHNGTFAVPDAATVTGTGVLLSYHSVISGPGTLTASGTLGWTGGGLGSTGHVVVNGTLTISGSDDKSLDGGTLENAGLITFAGSGYLGTGHGATLNNRAGATFDFQTDGTGIYNQFGGATAWFNNAGTLKKSAGTRTASISGMALDNTGTVDGESGTLSLEEGGTLAGTLTAGAGGSVDLHNGTFAVPETATVTGNGVMLSSYGSLSGPGALIVTGTLGWTSGTVGTTGHLVINGKLAISGGDPKSLDGGTVDNAGLVTWTGSGTIGTGAGAVINNLAGATFDLQSDSSQIYDVFNGTDASFNNAGTLKRSAGAGTVRIRYAVVNNTGTVDIESGTLSLEDGATLGGTLTTGTNGALDFHLGTYEVPSAASVSGNGLVFSGGTLDGAGTFTIDGALTWTGGTMGGSGHTLVNGSLTLSAPDHQDLDGRTLDNDGTITWISGSIHVGDGAVINNRAGATFEARSDDSILNLPSGPAAFTNAGTFTKSAGTGTTAVEAAFTNTGLVQVDSGAMELRHGLSMNGAGAIAGSSSGTLSVKGDFLGKTTAGEQFAPPGRVLLEGSDASVPPFVQALEVLSQDQGAVAAGFNHNFAFSSLEVSPNSSVQLVDQFHGTHAEALYVSSLLLPATATLDLNNLHLYAQAAQIDGRVINGKVTLIPDGGPLVFNSNLAGKITSPGEVDDWTFSGYAGQGLSITLRTGNGGSPAPLAPSLNYANVTVLDTKGHVVASTSNSQAGSDADLLGLTVPADGTYHVHVQASSDHTTATGNYVIGLFNATSHTAPVNFDQPVNGLLDSLYSVDHWTFSSAGSQQVRFHLIGAAPQEVFDLAAPDGTLLFSGLTTDSDPVTLAAAGTYTLTAHATGGQGGAYAFTLSLMSQTDLTLGTPYQGTLAGSGQAQLFRVDVPAGQQLLITLTDAAAKDHNELYAKFGSPPTRADYDYRFQTPASANQQVLAPAAAPGTWYVLLYGESVPAPSTYSLTATAAEVLLTAMTPPRHGNASDMTLRLSGAGFTPATAVSLLATDGTAYPAATINVVSPQDLTATYPAGTLPVGNYTAQVSIGDGASAQLAGAFTVVQGSIVNFQVQIIVPNPIGFHVASTIYVEYSNTGDGAMPAPLLYVTGLMNGKAGALLTLDASRQTSGFWTSATPEGFSQSVQFLASGATPGILQPGESVTVPVYYAGWLVDQWDFSRPPITFSASVLKTDDTSPIDWSSMYTTLIPPGITWDAWSEIYANLQGQFGNTWGSYVSQLDANAAYLGQLGENVTDINRLWSFGLQQANGESSLPALSSAVDAQMPAPGLSLTFARAFAPTMSARWQQGPLGYGWVWTGGWLRRLTTQTDGTVIIEDADGSQRRFQPDRRNASYFARPGDHGTLSMESDQTFSLVEANGLRTHFRADGSVDFVENLSGDRITAGYSRGLLTSLTHSSGQSLQIAYSLQTGLITSVTDSAGRVTTYNYDRDSKHLIAVTGFDGRTVNYTYEDNNNSNLFTQNALLAVEHADGTHDYFSYDAQGRLAGTQRDGGAETRTFSYDRGLVATTDAAGVTVKRFYDDRGLLARIEDPLHNVVSASFDRNSDASQLTDPGDQTYQFAYDAAGNFTKLTDPLGQSTSLSYAQSLDRLASVTDPNGNAMQYSYGSDGSLAAIIFPDGSVQHLGRDAAGSVISQTDRRGETTQYTRDAAGRVIAETFADGSTVSYAYDGHGNLTAATDASGTTVLAYDGSDDLIQITDPNGRSIQFAYDSAGRRVRMTTQDGFTELYVYDAVGRLAGLTKADSTPIVTYTYDAAGRLSRKDLGNGTYTTYAYDTAGRSLHLVNHAPDSSVNSRFDYTINAAGWVTGVDTLDGHWSYSYNARGELTHALFTPAASSTPTQDITYTYDAAGNRVRTVTNGNAADYGTNSLNEYTTAGPATLTYDANGNLISRTDSTGTTTATYDARNRLISLTTPQGSWTYEYDVFGNRTAVTHNGQRTEYLVDPTGAGDVIGEYNSTGGLIAHYTQGLGLTSRVDAANQASYYDFDLAGSTSGLTGSAGTLVDSYQYDPFGTLLGSNESAANPFRYVGESGVMDDGSGALFMRNRYYDPGLGRFLAPDPTNLGGGTPNLYDYTANQPTSRIDPLGLDYINLGLSLGAGLGFGTGVIFDDHGVFTYSQVGAQTPGISASLTYSTADASEGWGLSVQGAVGPAFVGATGSLNWSLDDMVNHHNFKPTGEVGVGVGLAGNKVLGIGAYLTHTSQLISFDDPITPSGPPSWWRNHSGSSGSSQSVTSTDPNDKFGPAGYGKAHFVAANAVLPYRIDFENDPAATAPAQIVTISDQLDKNLNWNTFQLTEVGFGDTIIPAPAGSQHFQTTVNMTQHGQTFQVQIEAGIHSQTGRVYVSFYSIDPTTGLPPDVLTGFLPPEDGTGRGMGHVSYTVMPKPGLKTGTQIRNVAVITFDTNPPIRTDQRDPHDPSKGTDSAKQALVTIDGAAPTSRVQRLPSVSAARFVVRWSGADDKRGSGVASYDVYVSDNGGAFQAWVQGATKLSAVFRGQPGHVYCFYSVATDHAGNRQATPARPQTITRVAGRRARRAARPQELLARDEVFARLVIG